MTDPREWAKHLGVSVEYVRAIWDEGFEAGVASTGKRPIGTAPRDGTQIVLYFTARDGKPGQEIGWWYNGDWLPTYLRDCQVTHWAPWDSITPAHKFQAP